MARICWNTLSHFLYSTTLLMCAGLLAISMLSARLFLVRECTRVEGMEEAGFSFFPV